MSCSSCGNPNTTDGNCNCSQLGCCDNPCSVSQGNTAACENLQSQIENFSLQFFGEIVKTEVDGKIVWSLPCSLDTGLPANPRGSSEGLACYFLRLFLDGIIGLKGDKGDTGAAGDNGNNAYTVTLHSFTQPSLGSPNITVISAFNPAILAGLYVFISTSGWYLVNSVDGSGTLFLTLVRALGGAPATITAGKLVVPSGFPGASVTGPAGPQGPKGDPGSNAASITVNNGHYFAVGGTDFTLGIVYAAVDFTTSAPQFLFTDIGKYILTAVIDLAGLGPVVTTDAAYFKFRNVSGASDIPGSEHKESQFASGGLKQVAITARVTTTLVNQTIALFGKCDSASAIAAVAARTTMTYVRVE